MLMSSEFRSHIKKANRMFKPDNTIVEVSGRKIGEGYFTVITGPCSVESEEQIEGIAHAVMKNKAGFYVRCL